MYKNIKILKALVNDEIIVKEISLLKAIIAASVYVSTIRIISFIFKEVLNFFNKDLSFGFSLAIMTIATCINSIYVVRITGNIFQNNKLSNVKKNYFNSRKKDILSILLIMLGYILIRQSMLYEFLNKFKGPRSKENIEAICNNMSTIELPITVFILIIQMFIIAPILEELFFRGIIFNGILTKYNGDYKRTIIYSALIFAVAHLNIPQGINAMIVGIILCSIYYFTKSIKLSIFAHSINNFLIFFPTPNNIFMKVAYVLIGFYFLYKGIIIFKEKVIYKYG